MNRAQRRVVAGTLWAAGALAVIAALVKWGDYLDGRYDEDFTPAVLLGLLACALVGAGFFVFAGSQEK